VAQVRGADGVNAGRQAEGIGAAATAEGSDRLGGEGAGRDERAAEGLGRIGIGDETGEGAARPDGAGGEAE
jgi:hypothetical protein